MRRLCTEPPFTCASCEVQIDAQVVFHVGLPFCCAGCVAGGPCLCTYEEDFGDDRRIDHHRIDDPVRPSMADDTRSMAGAAR